MKILGKRGFEAWEIFKFEIDKRSLGFRNQDKSFVFKLEGTLLKYRKEFEIHVEISLKLIKVRLKKQNFRLQKFN